MTRLALMMGVAAMALGPGICCIADEGADPNAGGGGGAAFDAADMLAGTVDAIGTKLADLSDEQLTQLNDAETKGQKRSTLLAAIDREAGARADKAQAETTARDGLDAAIATLGRDQVLAHLGGDDRVKQLTQERNDLQTAFDAESGAWDSARGDLQARAAAGEASAAELAKLESGMAELGYTNTGGPENATIADKALFALKGVSADRAELRDRVSELEQLVSEANGADDASGSGVTYNQVQVDKLLGDLRTSMEAERNRAVKEAKTMAETKPRKREKGKALELGEADGSVEIADLLRDHASQVVLVDSEDVPIADLTPLAFFASAYRFAGGRAILDEKIEPPRGGVEREVLGAFVLVDGKPVGRAQLVAPFAIGGGRHTELPGGTLSFGLDG